MEDEKTEFPTHRLVRRLKEIKEAMDNISKDEGTISEEQCGNIIYDVLGELIRYYELKS